MTDIVMNMFIFFFISFSILYTFNPTRVSKVDVKLPKASSAVSLEGSEKTILAITKDGEYLVKGKRVTGFTNAEEQAVGLSAVVPFWLEDRLKQRGAVYSNGVNWAPHVQVDGKLVTGQNPASSGPAAKELLTLLRPVSTRV